MQAFNIPVAVSNSHVHLSKEDAIKLFGSENLGDAGSKGHALFNLSDQHVTFRGPKGKLEKVKILIPFTRETWVELNRTHAFQLGLKPPLENGELSAGSLVIEGPSGKVEIKKNVVLEVRHMEISSELAKQYDLTSDSIVSVEVAGPRALLFHNVKVRIVEKAKPGFTGNLELDRDEANAALLNHGDMVKVLVP